MRQGEQRVLARRLRLTAYSKKRLQTVAMSSIVFAVQTFTSEFGMCWLEGGAPFIKLSVSMSDILHVQAIYTT